MYVQTIAQALSFPFILLVFMRIVLQDHERKKNSSLLLTYLIFFITFLPVIWVPFNFRIFYYMLGVFSLIAFTKKLNIYQSFWLTILYFLMIIVFEFTLQLISVPIFNWLFPGDFTILVIFTHSIMMIILPVSILVLKKHFLKFINHSHIVKNYQITYPIIIVISTLMLSFYMGLIITKTLEFRVHFFFSMFFIALLILAGIIAIILTDKYLKSKNELERLNLNIMKFRDSNKTNHTRTIFEESIEYDLMNSEFSTKLFEDYELSALLYKSNNSTIYLLNEKTTNSTYTMKVIEKNTKIKYDFSDLMQIINSAIMPIVQIGEGDKYHYVIKPFAQGIDLDDYVSKNGPFNDTELKWIANQLATILDALHNYPEPVIYRDLKPSNIVFNPKDKSVILIDIESTRKLKSDKNSDTFIIGSRGYTPPEQYGFSQTLPQSDIYAYGATLYYLATGITPDFRSITENNQSHNIPESHMEIIRKCMAFNPNDRYQSLQEILLLI